MTFEAVDLAVRYGRARTRALDGVTMKVPKGAFYAVLGPNGSGKSTLMRALLGVVPPESGRVLDRRPGDRQPGPGDPLPGRWEPSLRPSTWPSP